MSPASPNVYIGMACHMQTLPPQVEDRRPTTLIINVNQMQPPNQTMNGAPVRKSLKQLPRAFKNQMTQVTLPYCYVLLPYAEEREREA